MVNRIAILEYGIILQRTSSPAAPTGDGAYDRAYNLLRYR